MIGDHELYELLYNYEQDFKKIFKIKADFDSEMKLTEGVIGYYAGALRKLCDEEKLRPFDRSAISAIVEFGVRRAGGRGKISTRFADVLDVAREAHYFAEAEQCPVVTGEQVRRAREAHRERHNLIESKIQELIEEHVMLIDVTGSRIGQVNGLSVAEVGGYAFGRPVRITASVSMGKAGIINIEREANLSGKLYDKGIQILSGYLRKRFAQDKPLSLAASICFEQSYTGVDGDSASSTEVYAIISALAGIPLRQDVAVTGSVNQQGDVQAIGGVNQKIEGFFDVCKAKGITGTQGVIIPQDNVKDLMLREDVVQAIAEKQFHIYPIATIDQGIEILTGHHAGERGEEGKFEEDTVNALADARLLQLAKEIKEFE
jgi:ATP-dependent Lon protease